ncbi:CTD kinase subunit gamma CTK3-domain-containing protein [Cokeromyces recurvatus]|uniref:CTD kinase subunit gamma CTK3-domain-containing protein n=1 Tax=Cokeromyces recurvatus TaxID=90255 RepID=UPI00221F017F|nr:CTD kinase subunit gamma CTK3-domain-containing protein [Cokeromyces recurvatus]KAI7901983.1 CTD kinase subunit gamma CTK3-domain-containing protein [Cokeromyces recurvatus]
MSEESDPFECRLHFLSLLNKLNASQQSIHKVAIFAMRHRKLSEDLYNCLLEQLEKASLNARLNIIYVLDAIFSASQKSKYSGYINLTRPDLSRIIHAVVANGPKGVLNIPSTQKILNNWKRKGYFEIAEIEEAEKPLLKRNSSTSLSQSNSTESFSKEDILRRMEEDRERHKRLREEIWIRPAEESRDAEFEEFWNTIEALDPETDYEIMMKQNMLRLPNYAWQTQFNQRSTSL